MNTENPTIDEIVEFRDQLLKAREDVLDKFFLLEDLLKEHRDKEPEELRDIHDGLREGDRLLRGINERLAYTHRLMLRFEELPNEDLQDIYEIYNSPTKRIMLDRLIVLVVAVLIAIAIIAL